MPDYIHERDDWPAFRWDHKVLGARLAAVRHKQGRLLGRMEGLGFALRDEARLQTLTDDVLKSSEIEGEILDREQVRSSIARRLGIEIGALTPGDRDVEGVVEMMLDATQRFDAPLTAERLHGWHAALFPTGRRGLSQIIVGAWRDDSGGPMQVVSGPYGKERVHYEAPAAARLAAEMQAFLAWFGGEQALDPVLIAALAHLRFVTIHPFDDGNGRIARAIADMQLARSEGSSERFYSMSSQIRAERNAYYDILEATQKGDMEITDWLLWFLSRLEQAINGAEALLAGVMQKARFWEAHRSAGLNDRQQDMLNRLLNGFRGNLTSSKWAKIQKCSPDTALRDITDLIERGILRRNEAGGRSTSYALSDADGDV
jgi:Fic family protein